MRKQKKTSIQKYFFSVLALTMALKIATSYIVPLIVTVCFNGWLEGEVREIFSYFLITSILETIYLVVPIILISAVLLTLFRKSLINVLKLTMLFSFSCIGAFILFTAIFPDFLDFWGVEKHPPYLGYFYYSLFNGFVICYFTADMLKRQFAPMYQEEV